MAPVSPTPPASSILELPQPGPRGIGLGDLLQQVQDAIRSAFPREHRIWVRAEVMQSKTTKGRHLNLELAEHDAAGKLIAKTHAWIWAGSVATLNGKFAAATGGEIRAGIKVLLQVTVDYRPSWDLALTVHDIDPAFTIGDMEAKLAAIRERLQTEGTLDNNRRFSRPTEFCRVVVVSPANAAGLGDFQRGAEALERRGLCRFDYHPAPFQGADTATGILAALRTVYRNHREQPCDALAIIRGGGAKTDLYFLNEYAIANAVCRMQLPVLVGVGHEQDKTILDEVANQSFGTPSKVIEYIEKCIVENARQAERDWRTITHTANRRLDHARAAVEREQERLRAGAREHLLNARNEIHLRYRDITRQAQHHLEVLTANLRQWFAEIIGAGPQQALKRGYAVVRDQAGKPVTRQAQALRAKLLELEFSDGRVQAEPRPPIDHGEKSS